MRKEKVNTYKLGLFVTITTLLFVLAVYLIGNEQNLFRPTFRLYAVFHNVEGLKTGNIVRYSGIDVGVVQQVLILSDSTVRVEMVLQKEIQPFIKKDALAGIGSDGLVGNKIVNISAGPGNGTSASVEEQDIIQTHYRPATDAMLEVLSTTNKNLALFSVQLLAIAEKVNEGSGTATLLLDDAALADDLRQTVNNLKYTSKTLRSMGVEMQQTLLALDQGDGLLHDLLHDTIIMSDLKTISGTLNRVTGEDLAPLLVDLRQSAAHLTQASATANEILQQIDAGKGALGTLISDTATEKEVKQTLSGINESVQRFNENMEAMRHNFLFRKYFRKLEKGEKGQ
jgi:phospholipid/cholesterol/gamma-HCH transport system substrate-binding protein